MRDTNPLDRYVVPLRRWWPLVLGALVLGWGVVWLTLPEPPPEPTGEGIEDPDTTYRATHVLLVNSASPSAPQFDLIELLARQGDLTNRVVERLDGDVTAMDVDEVILEPNTNIGTLSITAVQPDPDVAAALARTFAEELISLLDERTEDQTAEALAAAQERATRLNDQIEELEEERQRLQEDSLDRRLVEAELEASLDQYASVQQEIRLLTDQQASPVPPFETLRMPSPVSTLADEEPSMLQVPQGRLARFALATVLALIVGVGAVFGIDHVDTRLRTRHDAEEAFGLPVVAELVRRSAKQRAVHPLPVLSEPDGPTAEAVRTLRLSILMSPTWRLSGEVPAGSEAIGSFAPVADHEPPRSLLITSPTSGDGKTTLVANLAASLAQSGQRVLVLDCDFRRPAVSKMLAVPSGKGLRDLAEPFEQPLKDLVVTTGIRGIDIVRSGAEAGIAPPWFLANAGTVLDQAIELADIVVVDSGPLLLTNEAIALIPSVDTTLLVARAGRVSYRHAHDAVERLTRIGANVGGVAFVGGEGTNRYGYYQPAAKAAGMTGARGSSQGPLAGRDQDVSAGS